MRSTYRCLWSVEYMNIKLFYGVSGSTTLGIYELDGSMRTSECYSPPVIDHWLLGFTSVIPDTSSADPAKLFHTEN